MSKYEVHTRNSVYTCEIQNGLNICIDTTNERVKNYVIGGHCSLSGQCMLIYCPDGRVVQTTAIKEMKRV